MRALSRAVVLFVFLTACGARAAPPVVFVIPCDGKTPVAAVPLAARGGEPADPGAAARASSMPPRSGAACQPLLAHLASLSDPGGDALMDDPDGDLTALCRSGWSDAVFDCLGAATSRSEAVACL